MSDGQPYVRFDSGQTSLGDETNTNGSNSAESLGRETPSTPPQVSLDPVVISGASEFSNLFPWIQHGNTRSRGNSVSASTNAGGAAADVAVSAEEDDYLAAFQRKATIRLPRSSLQAATAQAFEQPSASADMTPALGLSHSTPLDSVAGLDADQGLSSSAGHAEPAAGRTSFSSATVYPSDQLPRHSLGERSHAAASSSSHHVTGAVGSVPEQGAAYEPQVGQVHAPAGGYGSSPHPSSTLSRSSPASTGADLGNGGSIPGPQGPQLVPGLMELAEEEWTGYGEVLDLFEDDRLPGYQVWKRGSSSSSAMAVRIPRQMVGWKAVLMDANGFDATAFNAAESIKEARRASKVLGKQGWEVRQEGLKNSYDFRRGSGILATMHAGHRLFKHDWHIMIKDGSRYMWRMDKQALALYREDSDVKIAEFRKALSRSATRPEPVGGGGSGYVPDAEKRIGTFKYEASLVQPGILDINLALISLMAVFGARGGHQNVSAAFEPSSDPLRKVLEQQRQETPDREEVMLTMPRPGFARDNESVLSDTTDEDAGEVESDLVARYVTPGVQAKPGRSPPYGAPDGPPSRRQFGDNSHAQPANTTNRKEAGRKRFSSFFGRGSAPSAEGQLARGPMTDSQKIARQYRTQSMFFGR